MKNDDSFRFRPGREKYQDCLAAHAMTSRVLKSMYNCVQLELMCCQ